MKLLKSIIVILFAATILSACADETPESVAESYVKAYLAGDYKKAAKHAASEYGARIIAECEEIPADLLKKYVEERKAENKGIKYKIIDAKVEEKEASVKFEFTLNDKTDTGEVDLVKEDGIWKVEDESLYLVF